MTLRIRRECIQLCHDLHPIIRQIARFDRGLADQLRRAVQSIGLNLAESDGVSGGNRRQRRLTALGSARETATALAIAVAFSYIRPLRFVIRNRVNHIIGAIVLLTRR